MYEIIKNNLTDSNLCRICLIETSDLRSLYKSGKVCGEVTKLAIMLRECTALEVDENDGLPGHICNKCVIQVSKAYALNRQCRKSDKILRVKLENLRGSIVEETVDENSEMCKEEDIELDDRAPDQYMIEEVCGPSDCHLVNQDEHESCIQIKFENDGPDIIQLEMIETSSDCKEEMIDQSEIDEIEEVTQHDHIIESVEEECDISISSSEALTQIVFPKPRNRTKSRKSSFKCDTCGKVLCNSSSFKYHLQLHSDITPFLCTHCGEGFKTKNAYDGHMITHDENNPHKCEICGKTYRQAASLRSHMLTHTGEKPYLCGICGKGMTQKSGFKKHMLVHTGEKPFQCDICGRDFRFSSNLIMHKRYHTGDKPFICNICDKRFPGSEALKRHLLVHTGEKPYACEFCDRRFNRQNSLRIHRNMHTGEKKFLCTICGKGYIQQHCLTTHIKLAHQIVK